jgi:parallel beta-helix repeat protein
MLNRKGKIQTKGIITIIIVLSMVLISTFIVAWWFTRNEPENSSIMLIEKDEDFTNKYNLPGSGTEVDPYRIEYFHIDQVYTQIDIKDTTKFFVIQSSSFYTQTEYIIRITNAANGTGLIRECDFLEPHASGSYDMILINNSAGCKIIDNTFYSEHEFSSARAIRIFQSNNILIEDNFMMFLETSINLFKSNNSKIINNDCGFANIWWLQSSIKVDVCHNVEIINNFISHVNRGIASYHSEDIIVFNNSISYCTTGIKFNDIIHCNITKNVIHRSNEIGIEGDYSDSCFINNNTIDNTNGTGIFLTHCDFNNVTSNTFINSTNYALRLYLCVNNTIWNNNFIDNNVNGTIYVGVVKYYSQGYDNNNNFWNLDSLSIGNYWSDLIWNSTATYTIDWGSNIDFHPLEYPV